MVGNPDRWSEPVLEISPLQRARGGVEGLSIRSCCWDQDSVVGNHDRWSEPVKFIVDLLFNTVISLMVRRRFIQGQRVIAGSLLTLAAVRACLIRAIQDTQAYVYINTCS